ncbi:hypothetical protein [Streptomyces palmae]|uniref:hypothetical protein n=1 Tax=Streptomyces palmae TaxID=1701085 RepID=UPI001432CEF6|nr:hypothetical protein [Streptomyces palmae]
MSNQQCATCNGTGRVQVERHHSFEDNVGGPEYEERQCGTCGGSGWVEGGSR